MVRTIDKATITPAGSTRLFGSESGTTGNFTPAALAGVITGEVNVEAYGAVRATTDPTFDNGPAFIAASVAAGGGVVIIPAHEYTFATTWSLSGCNCGWLGQGSYTILRGLSSLAGPVVNLTGWTPPDDQIGYQPMGRVTIKGAGAADATKVRTGLEIGLLCGVDLHDLSVTRTGGAGIHWTGGGYANALRNISLGRPVGADTNDVPYLHLRGWGGNGTTWQNIMFRNEQNHAVSGTLVDGSAVWLIEDDGTYVNHDTAFQTIVAENLRTPEGGSIIRASTNGCLYEFPRMFDCAAATNATTDTCVIRLVDPPNGAATNYGGNLIAGNIYGRESAAARLAYGVILAQSRNAVVGVKGFNGYCVRYASGVQGCYAQLGGQYSGAIGVTGIAGVDDASGNTANTVIDHTLGVLRWGATEFGLSALAGLQSEALLRIGTDRGGVAFGSGGAYVRAPGTAPTELYHNAIQHTFRGLSNTPVGLQVNVSGASPTIGFLGATPVARQAAPTAANAGALNTGDATSDTVVGNMRTRIGELEAALRAFGLLT